MKGKTKINWIELSISILALLISLLTFTYAIVKDNNDNKEIISVTYTSYSMDSKLIIDKCNIPYLNIVALLPMNYGIIISNNSKKTISITEANVENITDYSLLTIPGQYDGVYSSEHNKVQLPIVLNPGESKQYFIRMKLGLKSNVIDAIKRNDSFPIKIERHKLIEILDKNHIDIYGNAGAKKELESLSLVTYEDFKSPSYLLSFKTSTNQSFKFVINVFKYSK